MKSPLKSIDSESLLPLWKKFEHLPLGKHLFSKVFGVYVPYTGQMKPLIQEIKPGFAQVKLHDRRGVRNHLSSIHAMAMANLGELATGLALISSLPKNTRAIVVGFSIEYLKKARGTLTAESQSPVTENPEKRTIEVLGSVKNAEGQEVARVKAQWLVGPK